MLTGKQKRYLRSLAHHLDPIFQVGKGGVNEHIIRHINDAIETRELIKVTVLNNCMEDRDEVAQQLADGAKAELVQVIGKIVVLYKESREHKTIELPV
ncbi:ribosome assembly RNA-binding protein YhbY [Paenibacillus mucilaginosus]|uniref:YqeI n=1 Tax=Paenibacillus mucilaginosus (strain KNP414) TaxID=1036673 RepID=F8FFT8_PAEMK|nr:ribosome assembly RNA-binding protein YhbY [Paenibacillus mucilaginosus]AEI42715.1 YqeI [Paenibacillus mucilaginosus KNP414]MCG7217042.1 ribosome assembly RNA-binding protein YhbY [Paenibacillus mucilaginosus]WDM26095.1 ribosome assembly RNA-binding protein YhbY [Paenibacillus mucilaginosus]